MFDDSWNIFDWELLGSKLGSNLPRSLSAQVLGESSSHKVADENIQELVLAYCRFSWWKMIFLEMYFFPSLFFNDKKCKVYNI